MLIHRSQVAEQVDRSRHFLTIDSSPVERTQRSFSHCRDYLRCWNAEAARLFGNAQFAKRAASAKERVGDCPPDQSASSGVSHDYSGTVQNDPSKRLDRAASH